MLNSYEREMLKVMFAIVENMDLDMVAVREVASSGMITQDTWCGLSMTLHGIDTALAIFGPDVSKNFGMLKALRKRYKQIMDIMRAIMDTADDAD